jgi:hypothetical protein
MNPVDGLAEVASAAAARSMSAMPPIAVRTLQRRDWSRWANSGRFAFGEALTYIAFRNA